MVQAFQSAKVPVGVRSTLSRGTCARAQHGTAPEQHASAAIDRRAMVLGAVAAATTLSSPARADGGDQDDYKLFKPDKKKTPALRAGTVDREKPYSFLVPTNWSEQRVPNIQSGNYCQPRCAEPWTEGVCTLA